MAKWFASGSAFPNSPEDHSSISSLILYGLLAAPAPFVRAPNAAARCSRSVESPEFSVIKDVSQTEQINRFDCHRSTGREYRARQFWHSISMAFMSETPVVVLVFTIISSLWLVAVEPLHLQIYSALRPVSRAYKKQC